RPAAHVVCLASRRVSWLGSRTRLSAVVSAVMGYSLRTGFNGFRAAPPPERPRPRPVRDWVPGMADGTEQAGRAPVIAVLGSVNMELVTTVTRRPQPGDTIAGRHFATAPGGNGANPAVAA